MLYLIFEEFSKVLHVHFCLFTIYNCDSSVNFNVRIFFYSFNCSCYIR